jgi:tetratricopeptide (TPR) repeat protein
MPTQPRARLRPVIASVILTLFFGAVAAAAAVGWWYARESPAHQGPIVLISVDGIPTTALPAYGAQRTDTPAIDMLASEAVVFDRAYAHTLQMLPAHASLLTGQLPFEHGVRDEAGFALKRDAQTLAELLRNRGFTTGAAVSSFLLRPASGISQGFTFYDAELPATIPDAPPALERDGPETVEAAERWVRTQDDQRFFLFVQVNEDDADVAVTRLSNLLKSRNLYDQATIVLVGDRADAGDALTLDEAKLRIPLLVKQPEREGAGRRIPAVVQQIDLVPTILDLVRAPVPGELRGRSLRAVLGDDEATIGEQPVYSESLASWYRFGGEPLFALTSTQFHYVRGRDEALIPLLPSTPETSGGEAAATGTLRRELDQLLDSAPLHPPAPIAASDEERFALFGYLIAPRFVTSAAEADRGFVSPRRFDASEEAALAAGHRAAALLIGQKKYSAGIRALQAIAGQHPDLAVVHYQIGVLLVRTGRLDEGTQALRRARHLQPSSPDLALALADALVRAGQAEAAQETADEAIALARQGEAHGRAAAYEMAARVALARNDTEGASRYAAEAAAVDPARPVAQFIAGRLLYEQGEYEKAAAAFQEAIKVLGDDRPAVADLRLYLGESLAHLDRYTEAETEYREELRAFPLNIQAYASLAMLYRASNRHDAVEDVLNELVSATRTPEGYAVAAKLWTILGDRSRAEALRSAALARFREDPQPARLGRGALR